MSDAYADFLKAKVRLAESWGFDDVVELEINPVLKPHQRAAVMWNVRGGRRGDFLAFGLGKSVIQLETQRLILSRVVGRGLIICPLGVRQEFVRDAVQLLGWATPPKFIRSIDEAGETGIYLTNYETVRDGKIDPAEFVVVSLDEAAILRGFGGSKTFRELMLKCTGDGGPCGKNRTDGKRVRFRFVATATPSPNEYIELLAYAEFLGIMDISQAKTRFFKRDSTKADNLTLHPHKEHEFWMWVASWALFVQRPSDLGFSDEGYELPPMEVRWHEVATDHSDAGYEKSGQKKMLRDSAIGVQDAAAEKRISLPARMAKLMEIRADDPAAHRIIWHDLEDERRAIEAALPRHRFNLWEEYKDGHADALALYDRHYSARDCANRTQFVGPGEKMVLLTAKRDALFAWRKFIDDSGQQGVNCAVFRNEGKLLASDLIKEAMAIAWLRWPDARLYTYVDADEVRSANPGCCFKMAGWKQCGETKGGLLILEALPGVEVPTVITRPGIVTVCGADTDEHKESSILGFSDGKFPELAGKPCMLGAGVNFQRFCAWAVFLGIGFKFQDFIQAVHRIQRFLQPRPVRIDIIFTEAEREVRKQLERKWRQHNQMVQKMTEIIRQYGLSHAAMAQTLTRKLGVERIEIAHERYRIVNNDCVQEARRTADNSVGLILTSIPFSSQYEYSPNYADFGHSEGNAEFFGQMDFLTPELLRVLQPGRIAAIHVKDRIVPMGMTGLGCPTVYPFHSECIRHYVRHGFAYMGMKTIVTDVVRENNQTYRLGWTEQCKDGTKMGVGMPEYLLLFRKPATDRSRGYADLPVVKQKSRYTRARWQTDAHAFMRSNGNRGLTPEDIRDLAHKEIFRAFRDYSLNHVYDFEHHVKLGESLEVTGKLPSDFMLLQPQSWSAEVWTDITRMLTLNGAQAAKGKEMHLCPMQFDLADRVIEQFSMEGETVLDPFGGLMTVPYRAIKKKRFGVGFELSAPYFVDGATYCRTAAEEMSMPTLFDVTDFETAAAGTNDAEPAKEDAA
jgi:DNA modification methylase